MTRGSPLSRLAALALLAVLAFGYWQAGLQPILDGNRQRASLLETRAAQVLRYRAVLEQAERQSDGGAALAAASERLLLEGDSANQAAAALQNLIGDAVGASALQLDSLEPAGTREGDLPGTLRLRLKGSGDIAALQEFLYLMESAPPVIILEQAHVRARSVSAANGQPLGIDLTLRAFARPGAPS